MALTVKRPETLVRFCLDGELKARHEAAEAEFTNAKNRMVADKRMVDPTRTLAQAVLDLEAEMEKSTVVFTVRGFQRGKWVQLKAEHAPRQDNGLDKAYGFNVESLMIEAIPQAIAGVVDSEGAAVEFDPAKEFNALADDMTDSQYEDFVLAVLRVNAGRNDVPFSLSAFRMTQDSELT